LTEFKLRNAGSEPRSIYTEADGRVDLNVDEEVEVSEKTFNDFKGHSHFEAVKDSAEAEPEAE